MESKPSKGPDTPEEHGGGSDNNSPNVSGGTTSASEKKKRGKRYNLKLSTEHRIRFQEPYHDYLNALLDQLPPKDSATSTALSSRLVSSLHTAPKGTDWTVWISLESRSRFLDKKAIYAPGATHSEFVEFLLRNREETRRGELSPGVEAAAGALGAMKRSAESTAVPESPFADKMEEREDRRYMDLEGGVAAASRNEIVGSPQERVVEEGELNLRKRSPPGDELPNMVAIKRQKALELNALMAAVAEKAKESNSSPEAISTISFNPNISHDSQRNSMEVSGLVVSGPPIPGEASFGSGPVHPASHSSFTTGIIDQPGSTSTLNTTKLEAGEIQLSLVDREKPPEYCYLHGVAHYHDENDLPV